MDEIVDPPADTRLQKAAVRFISGKVIASPAMAMAPTPCPMKILSMMLYSDTMVMLIMAGMEYCSNSFPMLSVPRMCGLFIYGSF